MPTRALAECPMLAADASVESQEESHAGHHAHGESAPAPAESAPEHTDCPDLAHCAVVALTTSSSEVRNEQPTAAPTPALTPDAPRAPARSIEPPPPKR